MLGEEIRIEATADFQVLPSCARQLLLWSPVPVEDRVEPVIRTVATPALSIVPGTRASFNCEDNSLSRGPYRFPVNRSE